MKKIINFSCLVCFIVLIFLFFITNQSMATTYCVANATDLMAALNEAKDNGTDDIIKIQRGTYNGNFIYASAESFSVTIEGGYNVGCTSRVVEATNTVLDGQNSGGVLKLDASSVFTDFVVDGMTLQNGESSEYIGGLYAETFGAVSLSNNIIRNNICSVWHEACAGGVYIVNSNTVTLFENIISNNYVPYGFGGVYVKDSGAVTLTHNNIENNECGIAGLGGVRILGSSTATLANNTINNNRSGQWDDGGVSIVSGSVVMANNIICRNSAPDGNNGGVAVSNITESGTVTLVNNTVCNNNGGYEGGGIHLMLYHDSSIANIHNNIMWNNSTFDPIEGIDLYIQNDGDGNGIPSIVNLYNNNFDQSSSGTYIQIPFTINSSNLDNFDPHFVDALNNDYHLTADSPLIDRGTNSAPELPTKGKDGKPRIIDGDYDGISYVDIGAYEFGSPRGDLDGDGDVDGEDLRIFAESYGTYVGPIGQ